MVVIEEHVKKLAAVLVFCNVLNVGLLSVPLGRIKAVIYISSLLAPSNPSMIEQFLKRQAGAYLARLAESCIFD